MLSCLYRCDRLVLNAARVLAVTGEPLHGSLLPHLVDARLHPALGAVDKSTSAGLIDEQGLRHPAVTQAVIDGMTAEERVRLHLGAARLLHDDGAPPARIAPHLVDIGELAEAWMAQTLLDAGEQALLDGEVETALRYLRRAHRSGVGECLRARIRPRWRAPSGDSTRRPRSPTWSASPPPSGPGTSAANRPPVPSSTSSGTVRSTRPSTWSGT
ncbi:hypothetical protein V2I01_31485 [Micromonospora sp. BRA006-A]|nr:hypothetical protein [Micromonospora sp. BRA006-A]